LQRFEKQVHQKRLAATNATPDIESVRVRNVGGLSWPQEVENATPAGAFRLQTALQFLEFGNYCFLRNIAFVTMTMQAFFVGLAHVQDTGYPL